MNGPSWANGVGVGAAAGFRAAGVSAARGCACGGILAFDGMDGAIVGALAAGGGEV